MDMYFLKGMIKSFSIEIKFIFGCVLFKISENIYFFKCVCVWYVCFNN